MPKTAEEIAAEAAAKEQAEALKTLATGMADMLKRFDTIEGNVGGLTTRFDELATPPTDPSKPLDKGKDKDKDGKDFQMPDNLETMDRKQFLGVVVDAVSDALQSKISNVSDNVTELRTGINKETIQKEVNGLMKDNKDFKEWLPEMQAIAQKNPGLSPTRYYQLAKLDNPTKVTEMGKQYGDEKDKEASDTKVPFGSLTPTSGVEQSETDMKPDVAANKAYDTIFGGETTGDAG